MGRVMKRSVTTAIGAVQIRPSFDQLGDYVEMAIRGRDQQRRRPLLRLRINGSPKVEQQADGGQMTLCGRLEQRRPRTTCICLNVCTSRDEQPYEFVASMPGSADQWREAIATFDVSTTRDQQCDDVCVPLISSVS